MGSNKRRLTLAVGLLILGSACGRGGERPDANATAAGASPFGRALSLALTEVAYRYLFDHNASAKKNRASFYCLAQGGLGGPGFSAAPDGMTRRLSDVSPPVLNYPECKVAADSSVIAKSKRGLGIIFYISSIECENTFHCEVTGGYYEGNMSASEQVLKLKKSGDLWAVVGVKLESIV